MLHQKKMSEILNFEQQRIYQQNMNVIKTVTWHIQRIYNKAEIVLWLWTTRIKGQNFYAQSRTISIVNYND